MTPAILALLAVAHARVPPMFAFSVASEGVGVGTRITLSVERSLGAPHLDDDGESEAEDTLAAPGGSESDAGDTGGNLGVDDALPPLAVVGPAASADKETIADIRSDVTEARNVGVHVRLAEALTRLAGQSVDALREHLVGCMHHSARDEFRNHFAIADAAHGAALVAAAWMSITQIHAELCAETFPRDVAVVGLRATIRGQKTAAEIRSVHAALGLPAAGSRKDALAAAVVDAWLASCGTCAPEDAGSGCERVTATKRAVREGHIRSLRQRYAATLPDGPPDYVCPPKGVAGLAALLERPDTRGAFADAVAHAQGVLCVLDALAHVSAESVADYRALQTIVRDGLARSIAAERSEFVVPRDYDPSFVPAIEGIAQFAKTRTLAKRAVRALLRIGEHAPEHDEL